jgi:cytochrome b561
MRRYSIPSIVLHWSMALAIAAAWLLGTLVDDFPRGDPQVAATGAHILIGLIVLALLLPRVMARLSGGAPEVAVPEWEKKLAGAAHLLLYGLMLALPLTGIALALSARATTPVLGLFDIPPLLAPLGLRGTFKEAHELLSNLMLGTVGLHVLATLWHALVRRDGVWRHMLPGGAKVGEAG